MSKFLTISTVVVAAFGGFMIGRRPDDGLNYGLPGMTQSRVYRFANANISVQLLQETNFTPSYMIALSQWLRRSILPAHGDVYFLVSQRVAKREKERERIC